MKTVVILATYIGLVNRGAESFVIEIVKKLSNDFNFEIYSLGSCEEIKDKIITVDFKLPIWFAFHNKLYNKYIIYRFFCDYFYTIIPSQIEQKYFSKNVYNRFLKGRNDINLIFPNNGFYGAKYAHKFRKIYKTPFIYTGHGGIGEGEKRILLQKPDIYISLTNFHKEWANKFSNNVIKIHNGVDVSKFNILSENSNSSNKTILCVAALTKFKRQKLLIDAVSKMNNVNLILIGDGENKKEILEYGHNILANSFKLFSVPYNEIKKYYAMCDVFSLPSINEPFGIVYLEAMSMNLPIVAPDDSSRREIIGDAGLFCDVENVSEYANTLTNALNIDWSDIPRNRAVLNFSWDKISIEYKKLFNNLTSNSNSTS